MEPAIPRPGGPAASLDHLTQRYQGLLCVLDHVIAGEAQIGPAARDVRVKTIGNLRAVLRAIEAHRPRDGAEARARRSLLVSPAARSLIGHEAHDGAAMPGEGRERPARPETGH